MWHFKLLILTAWVSKSKSLCPYNIPVTTERSKHRSWRNSSVKEQLRVSRADETWSNKWMRHTDADGENNNAKGTNTTQGLTRTLSSCHKTQLDTQQRALPLHYYTAHKLNPPMQEGTHPPGLLAHLNRPETPVSFPAERLTILRPSSPHTTT